MAKEMNTTPKKKLDLSDSEDDKKHMQSEKATLDLPEVKDIPGQEHVRPLLNGELADTTISSDDEEGKGILDDEDDLNENNESNVTPEEKELLRQSTDSMATEDDQLLHQAELDNEDEDGTPLNEHSGLSGNDLDVPGDDDDSNDDEENDSYSLNDDKEDEVNSRQ